MKLKKGNTYKLYCKPDNLEDIEKLVFALEDIQKVYKSDGTGDIINDDGTLIISFTQQETLLLGDENAEYEVAIKTTDGEVVRSIVKSSGTLKTIIKEAI